MKRMQRMTAAAIAAVLVGGTTPALADEPEAGNRLRRTVETVQPAPTARPDTIAVISAVTLLPGDTEVTVSTAVINLGDDGADVSLPIPVPPGVEVGATDGDGSVSGREWLVEVAPGATARRTFAIYL